MTSQNRVIASEAKQSRALNLDAGALGQLFPVALSSAARSEDRHDRLTIHELLGHIDPSTTMMIWLHVLKAVPGAIRARLDRALILGRRKRIDCETSQLNMIGYGSGQPFNLLAPQVDPNESQPTTEG